MSSKCSRWQLKLKIEQWQIQSCEKISLLRTIFSLQSIHWVSIDMYRKFAQGPLKKDETFSQYWIRILKALCFTNLIWPSVLRKRHQVLGKEMVEGKNSKGFSIPSVCGYKNISGSEDSARNKACVSGLKWTFTLLTNISELVFTDTVALWSSVCCGKSHVEPFVEQLAHHFIFPRVCYNVPHLFFLGQ